VRVLAIPILQKHMEFLISRHAELNSLPSMPDELGELFSTKGTRSAIMEIVNKGIGHLTQVRRYRNFTFDHLPLLNRVIYFGTQCVIGNQTFWKPVLTLISKINFRHSLSLYDLFLSRPLLVKGLEALYLSRLRQPHSSNVITTGWGMHLTFS